MFIRSLLANKASQIVQQSRPQRCIIAASPSPFRQLSSDSSKSTPAKTIRYSRVANVEDGNAMVARGRKQEIEAWSKTNSPWAFRAAKGKARGWIEDTREQDKRYKFPKRKRVLTIKPKHMYPDNILEEAKTPQGSKRVCTFYRNAGSSTRQRMLKEQIFPNFTELIMDSHSSFLISMVVKQGTHEQIAEVGKKMKGHVIEFAINPQTRVCLEITLSKLNKTDRSLLASELRIGLNELLSPTPEQVGIPVSADTAYVAGLSLERGSIADRVAICNAIAPRLKDMLLNDYFHKLVIKSLATETDAQRGVVATALLASATDIVLYSQDQQGSLVLQALVEGDKSEEHAAIISAFKGRVMELTHSKYPCYVIRALVRVGSKTCDPLIDELSDAEIVQCSKDEVADIALRAILKFGALSQKTKVGNALKGHMQELCEHSSHSRSFVHSCLANLKESERSPLVAEMIESPELIQRFVLHDQASHVLRFLIEEGEASEQETIVQALLGHVKELASANEDGAKTIMSALRFNFDETTRPALGEELLSTSEQIIDLARAEHTEKVILRLSVEGSLGEQEKIAKSLEGRMMKLATDPHGARLITSMFTHMVDTSMREGLAKEILDSKENIEQCSAAEHGRYVLAKLAETATPEQLGAIDMYTE